MLPPRCVSNNLPPISLRCTARRWEQLNGEITGHEKLLAELTTELAPRLSVAFGIGADTAAEMLIVAGDNPERVRFEPAWVRLCGVAPIPASSGMITRHRLNRGGHRQVTLRSTAPSSRACNTTNPPAPTSAAAPAKASQNARSVASNAYWPANPGS
jgi:hypothetical protein